MKIKKDEINEIIRLNELGVSISKIARKLMVSRSAVVYNLNKYKKSNVLKCDVKKKQHSPSYKLDVVITVKEGNSPYSLSNKLDITYQTILNWVNAYNSFGYNGLERKVCKVNNEKENRRRKEERYRNSKSKQESTETGRTIKKSGIRKSFLKKITSLNSKSTYKEKRFIAIRITELRQDKQFEKLTLSDMLRLANLNPKTYFYILKTLKKRDKDKDLKRDIKKIFIRSKKTYGYPRVLLKLRELGYKINHKKVQRIMHELGLNAFKTSKKKKYSSYKGEIGKICPNLLIKKRMIPNTNKVVQTRDFEADSPFKKLTTDVTEFKLSFGKIYFAPIMDLFSQEILSYCCSSSPNMEQQKHMMEGLFKRNLKFEETIFHSDQGWQYQHKEFQKLLKDKGMKQSMSRKGNCHDNSIMENFFGRMKNEFFYNHEEEFKTKEDFIKALNEYIKFYNNERIQVKLGGLSPVEYRKRIENQIQ